MGKRTFAQLVEKLEAYGLALTTPALLVESVSTPEQSIQRMTIKDLAELLRNNIGTKPAIIMYGPLADFTDG
jgi:uroporphyrin-III C-methyltransferase